ncbi:MAG: hypothetical protein JO165_09590 [Candidatus Eremiobacteraeota bacterium]|nr:hypothetical protein [Candidatus Eremiobacteraeota bacterium]
MATMRPTTLTTLSASALLVLLAACGGGGGGSGITPGGGGGAPTAPPATPTPPAISVAGVIHSGDTVDNGTHNMFTPPTGDTSSGGNGPIGNTVDGIPCAATMSNVNHIHVHVGIMVNGVQWSTPEAIGMFNPIGVPSSFINSATCFYYIHTHDWSGNVHVESPDPNATYTLGNFLDVWGMSIPQLQAALGGGNMYVYTGQGTSGHDANNTVSSYAPFLGDPRTITFKSHMAIWFVVNSPTVPEVIFNQEF